MRKIIDLNDEELIKVYKINSKLQAAVRKSYEDSQMYIIGEIIKCIEESLSSYSIKFYNNNFMNVCNKRKFIMGLKSCKFYSSLDSNEGVFLSDLISLSNKLKHTGYYDILVDEFNSKFKDLQKMVLMNFNEMTKINDKYLLYLFLNLYAEENLYNERFYIDEDYILYEKISYL